MATKGVLESMSASRLGWLRFLRLDGFIAILPERPWFPVGTDSTSYFSHGSKRFESYYRFRYGRNYNESAGLVWFHLYPLQISDLIENMRRYMSSLCFLGTARFHHQSRIMKGGGTGAILLNLGKEVIPA